MGEAIDAFIKDLVVKGVTTIKAIIKAIKEHFFPPHMQDIELINDEELIPNPIVCEDVLSEAACASLRKAAAFLKIKFDKVNEAIREAISKGITKADAIIAYVRDKLKKWAKTLRAKQLFQSLSATNCTRLVSS